MENTPPPYQAIARKYRPQTFQNVVGQDAIVTTLKNSLLFDKVAHAYLFCGSKGTGKTTLARLLAKALCCAERTAEAEPCNVCGSCKEITAGRSLDVLEIDGASNRGIDDVRQIKETVGYAPSSGRYRIYIIDEVHMLTKEAFNALLKVLEEPPAHVKFLFATTEPHKVPPTILSRCQRFDLSRIDPLLLQKKLSWISHDLGATCDEEALALIANLSEGSLRDAESLLDQVLCYTGSPLTAIQVATTLGLVSQNTLFALDLAFSEYDLSYPLELAASLFSSGKDLGHFVDQLVDHYRLLLKLKLGAQTDFPTKKLQEQYTLSTDRYTQEQCLYILDMLVEAQRDLSKTPFKRIHLEMLLLHIIRSKYKLSLPSLVKRLYELESSFKAKESTAAPFRDLDRRVPENSRQEQTPLAESYRAQEGFVNLDPARQRQIDLVGEAPLPIGKSDDERRFGEVAAGPNSQNQDENSEKKQPTLQTDPSGDLSIEPSREDVAPEPLPLATNQSQDAPPVPPQAEPPRCHYDTLIRFAAIELEGVIR